MIRRNIKIFTILLAVSFFALSAWSLEETNSLVTIGFETGKKEKILLESVNTVKSLESRYLNIVVKNLEVSAQEVGYVNVTAPNYVKVGKTYGFAGDIR